MNKMIALSLVLTMVIAGDVTPAFSDDEKPSNYVALKGGMIALQKIDNLNNLNNTLIPVDKSLDTNTGWGGQLAAGHYFMSFLALEIESGYFEIHNSKENSRELGDITLWIYPVLATVKVLLPLGIMEPYIEGGGGAYFSRVIVDNNALNGPWTSGTKTSYSVHAGGGLNIDLGNGVFLGFEGRTFWTRPEWGQEDIQIDGYTITGVLGFRL